MYNLNSLLSHSLVSHFEYVLRIHANVTTCDWTMAKCVIPIEYTLVAKGVITPRVLNVLNNLACGSEINMQYSADAAKAVMMDLERFLCDPSSFSRLNMQYDLH
jgi:hypothetical protein